MAEADTIVFDKTGTLTRACPTVAKVVSFCGEAEDELLRQAACLEEHFPHSVARAVVEAAQEKGLLHEELHTKVEYIVAHGIASSINGERAVIGSFHFVFEDEKVRIPRGKKKLFDSLPDEYSQLFFAKNGVLTACILIEDPMRAEVGSVVEKLRQRGFAHIVMMTGDSERTAARIAAEAGITEYYAEGLPEVIKQLNEAGMDLHVHTVGERASRIVLDGVELAQKELGDKYRVRVTCAHLEIQDDADLPRFAELGVIANFTPWWHAGNPKISASWLGEERAAKQFRCKTLWDSGALVTWSSDNVAYTDFVTWSPYLGMEVGMTRRITDKTRAPEYNRTAEILPPAEERMGIEEMLLGYTINGAKELNIENEKGSIEAGKDADFLVFANDLLTAEHEGFSQNKPEDVYICGKRVNR